MRLSDERGVERSELNVQSDPYSMIFKFKVNPSDMEWRLYNQSNDEKSFFLLLTRKQPLYFTLKETHISCQSIMPLQ